jgi:hypothetical protein
VGGFRGFPDQGTKIALEPINCLKGFGVSNASIRVLVMKVHCLIMHRRKIKKKCKV